MENDDKNKPVKEQLTEPEIEQIDTWIKRTNEMKGDFYFNKLYEIHYPDKNPDYDTLYHLLAHKANIISQHAHHDPEKYEYTTKGIEVFEHNGFAAWDKMNEERLEYIRLAPELNRKLTKSIISTNCRQIIISILTIIILGITTYIANEERKINKELLNQAKEKDLEQRRTQLHMQQLESMISSLKNQVDSLKMPLPDSSRVAAK